MKKSLSLITLCFIIISLKSQIYLPIEENHLLNCCNPTNADIKSYSDKEISNAFKYLIDTLKFEYRYVYGACENRAHFMSLALTKKGIQNKKIWCFAPLRYSFISRKQLWVNDPLKISDTVVWSYHVSPIVINNEKDTLVIDPSLSSNGPVKYKDWLKALHCPEAIYNFSDANWYLFNSFNGFKTYNNFDTTQPSSLVMPNWFPNVITGNFVEYDPNTQNIPSGLATNDIAIKIYQNEKNNLNLQDFKKILGNINNIIAFITDKTNKIITADFKNRNIGLVNKYSAEYKERKDYWNNILNTLRE